MANGTITPAEVLSDRLMRRRVSWPGRAMRLIAGLAALDGGTALAQTLDVTRIPAEPLCRSCRIEAQHVLRLGAVAGGSTIAGNPASVVRDRRGHYIVGESPNKGLPLVFDSTGRFLQRLGKRGPGPGEFLSAGLIFLARADSLYIYDWGTGRRSILSPSWKFVRAVPQAIIGRSGLVLPDGTLLLNALGMSTATAGVPLQVIDQKGQARRSFGGNYSIRGPESTGHLERHLALSRDGTIWVAFADRYRIERWTTSGRLVSTLERSNDFFRPGAPYEMAPDKVPPPLISSVHEDAAGRLWITIKIAAPPAIWKENFGEPRISGNGRSQYPYRLYGRLFHTLVEVIDVKGGRVVASQRLPFYVTAATQPGEFAAYQQDTDGNPFVDIWRVRLVQP